MIFESSLLSAFETVLKMRTAKIYPFHEQQPIPSSNDYTGRMDFMYFSLWFVKIVYPLLQEVPLPLSMTQPFRVNELIFFGFAFQKKVLIPAMTARETSCFSKSVILTTKRKENTMAYNNTAIITGNMGSEAKIIEKEGKTFASFSLASTDSYKNEQEEWVQKDTIWHDILVFSPRLVEQIKAFKKGTRLKITGFISYRPFEVTLADGRTVTKKEASIVAGKIELATLTKKAS